MGTRNLDERAAKGGVSSQTLLHDGGPVRRIAALGKGCREVRECGLTVRG